MNIYRVTYHDGWIRDQPADGWEIRDTHRDGKTLVFYRRALHTIIAIYAEPWGAVRHVRAIRVTVHA